MKPFQIYSDEYKRIDFQMKRGTSLQVHISDIHFGIMDPKTEYEILYEQFIRKIQSLPLDCISVDGDLFDRLYTSNTDAVLYANLFVSELIKICIANRSRGINTVLVLLLGTKNHDADQLKLFYPYLNNPNLDLRIIEKIQFEWINGLRVLCIPELYDISDEEYRRVLFESGAYDMVFMHGSIEGSVYDNGMGQAKIFNPSDFSFCMGPVVAGHIHTGPALHGFCYYNGSPIRWNFGEEEPKGFQIVLYDMDTRYYYIHKEIIHSFKYITVSINDIIQCEPDEIIEYINDLRVKEKIDYIRLTCVSNNDTQNVLDILKEYYRLDKTVKFKLEKERSMETKSMDEQTKSLYDQYSYFFNRSMSPYDILAKYINDSQSEVIVTADQIINALKEV